MLVVGTGQSGAQIAEDLHLAGRTVHLAVGTAPRVARFYRGRDCVAWLQDMGHYDLPVTDHPQGKATRKEANHYVTGRDGGHDLDLRAFAAEGLHLHGRLTHVQDGTLHFAGDLRANLDAADATMERIKDGIDRYIAANGIEAPHRAPLHARLGAADRRLRHARQPKRSARSCGRPASAATGRSCTPRGLRRRTATRALAASPRSRGLYFVGLPWLHTWGSGPLRAASRATPSTWVSRISATDRRHLRGSRRHQLHVAVQRAPARAALGLRVVPGQHPRHARELRCR